MGAWGTGVFENDDACDFAGEVAMDKDLNRLRSTLTLVLENKNQYLEAPAASEALAAADIVARLRGSWGQRDAYTDAVDKWVARSRINPDDALVSQALQAVQRVMTEPSELLELWSEDDASAFKQAVDELSQRLNSLNTVEPPKPGMTSRLKAFFSK